MMMEVKLDQEKLEKVIIEQAVAEIFDSEDSIYNRVQMEISQRIDKALSKNLNSVIEKTINKIMEQALDEEIHPVNAWGEREGEPTTVRAALHNRAKTFWAEKVDNKGEKSTYGGRPRYEHVLGIISAREFESQIKQNITNIAGAIKDAVRADFYKAVDAKLNEFFKVNSLADQKAKKK